MTQLKHKFAVGDLVTCRDTQGALPEGFLAPGVEYRVVAAQIADGTLQLRLDGSKYLWLAERFDLVEEPIIPARIVPDAATRLNTVQHMIVKECDDLKELLLEKNRKYGNAALEPKRIFSKASPVEQILVRLDDKLSRIATMGTMAQADEDTVKDFIGYLILLRVAQKVESN